MYGQWTKESVKNFLFSLVNSLVRVIIVMKEMMIWQVLNI